MGAGKSSIGKLLAEQLSLPFVDTDRLLEKQTGVSVAQIFDEEGETGFRVRERKLLNELLKQNGQIIASGGGAVLDPSNRLDMTHKAFVIYLPASVDQQLQRLANDQTRPLLQCTDRELKLTQLSTIRNRLYLEVADLVFEINHLTINQALQHLLPLIAKHWQPEHNI